MAGVTRMTNIQTGGMLAIVSFAMASALAMVPSAATPEKTEGRTTSLPSPGFPASQTSASDAAATVEKPAAKPIDRIVVLDMAGFLDRLRLAESGGRNDARNARSTALGPYQFIERTWLDLARRIFATETQSMQPAQILALRTDPAFSRRAAEAYTRDNAATLKAHGLEPTYPRLRLAFLLGPQGAVRVLQAPPSTRVTAILGPAVAGANPFMFGLTAESLLARAVRDLAVQPPSVARLAVGDMVPRDGSSQANVRPHAGPALHCNIERAACRRWQSLAIARIQGTRKMRKQLASARMR